MVTQLSTKLPVLTLMDVAQTLALAWGTSRLAACNAKFLADHLRTERQRGGRMRGLCQYSYKGYPGMGCAIGVALKPGLVDPAAGVIGSLIGYVLRGPRMDDLEAMTLLQREHDKTCRAVLTAADGKQPNRFVRELPIGEAWPAFERTVNKTMEQCGLDAVKPFDYKGHVRQVRAIANGTVE